jgi:hypothetical protein
MALPIIEQPLYGEVLIETSPWTTPFVWTNRTADLVAGINYTQGGRPAAPGTSQVDVGTLNATFKNLASVPAVGALVRISFSKFAGYAFVGYVQDVSQRIVFDQSVSFTTPIVLTTLNCNDWVGYVSQFQAIGAGGKESGGGGIAESLYYDWNRVQALNQIQDPSNSTKIIEWLGDETNSNIIGDTDLVGSLTEHLDLIAKSEPDFFWFGSNTIPTNITTGRNSLIKANRLVYIESTGKTFTDVAGSAGQLHYTEIDFENSTANVANNIVLNNRSRIYIDAPEVTRIGGFNEENFVVVDNTNVIGIGRDLTQEATDSSSVTTYGVRRTEIDTNVSYNGAALILNLIINPSMEYSDDGYTRNNTNCVVRRRQPSQDANPFAAYNGLWAMRSRQTVASPTARILFSGGEADGMPVVGGTTYYFKAYGARGTVSQSNMRARLDIRWYDDSESLLSTTSTANTSLTTANTWYLVSGSAAAPANAVRATMEILFERSSGANIAVGDRLWADAFMFSRSTASYFDGDFAHTTTYIYSWTGGVGTSPSYRVNNYVDDLAQDILAKYSTTSMRATRIRWNAQEQLSAIPSLTVGKTISLIYDGTTTTYRIVGIDASIDPERYMIDYYLIKD